MFEILDHVSEDDLVEAVYEATLRLAQPERSAWFKESELPLTDNELAAKLLCEIQQTEGKHVADLTQGETDRYILEITDVLERRMREKYPSDSADAEALLEELRAEYSWPHYGRRAS